MAARDELGRALHVSADGVNRADARLRSFGKRIGDAAMCPRCDGDGLILVGGWKGAHTHSRYVVEPVKCPDCGGEGLDPLAQQGGRQ